MKLKTNGTMDARDTLGFTTVITVARMEVAADAMLRLKAPAAATHMILISGLKCASPTTKITMESTTTDGTGTTTQRGMRS